MLNKLRLCQTGLLIGFTIFVSSIMCIQQSIILTCMFGSTGLFITDFCIFLIIPHEK